MLRDFKCAVADCFSAPRSPRRYCFAHQCRLERYGDPLGNWRCSDVQRLYDAVTDRVLTVTAKYTSATTADYDTIFQAVTALDSHIAREMSPEKKA
jgi:hypothetical protein